MHKERGLGEKLVTAGVVIDVGTSLIVLGMSAANPAFIPLANQVLAGNALTTGGGLMAESAMERRK